jgi:hypothetical protein
LSLLSNKERITVLSRVEYIKQINKTKIIQNDETTVPRRPSIISSESVSV